MSLDPAVASAVPLTYPVVPYKQLNTDAGFRFRITATNAGIGAGAIICRVYFGTPYRHIDANGMTQPMQPIVLISPNIPNLYVVNVTESSFDLQAAQSIAPLATRDVFGSASVGQVTV